MEHPLSLWLSVSVKELLHDFYEMNFQKGGVPGNIGGEIINLAWEEKETFLSQGGISTEINELFELAKKSVQPSTEKDAFNLFDWSSTYSLLDVGANKLRRINKVSSEYPHFKKFVGIDIIPQNGVFLQPEKSNYFQVDENAIKFPIESSSIDVVNIEFVLHHFPDEESIVRMLKNCYSALSSRGKLVLWEETFVDSVDVDSLANINNKNGILTDRDLTRRFYDLSEKERWEFIIVNDWIINAANPHMPWTGQYRNWKDWDTLLNKNGFKLVEEYNLGLRMNGLLKQGVHIVGLFQKL